MSIYLPSIEERKARESIRAQEVLFNAPNSWETYPYSSKIGGAGDLHFFKNIKKDAVYDGIVHALFEQEQRKVLKETDIPQDFVKLNIRNRLKELCPDTAPVLANFGFTVGRILEECGIKDYISAQDRGWEASDFWATLEAVFIPQKDYEQGILPKIVSTAEKTLGKREAETTEPISLKKVKNEKETPQSEPLEDPECQTAQAITEPSKP